MNGVLGNTIADYIRCKLAVDIENPLGTAYFRLKREHLNSPKIPAKKIRTDVTAIGK
jgi:hypothetical protein